MDYGQIAEISRLAIFTLIKVATPVLLLSLLVGLIISLFQALTQIQETTLSFVPKILTVFLSLVIFMPYIIEQLQILVNQASILMMGQSLG